MRLLKAISFALVCSIGFATIVSMGAATGILISQYVHWTALHFVECIASISFVILTALYYWRNP